MSRACFIAPAPLPAQPRSGGLERWNQLLLAVADQVGSPHAAQCIAQDRPIVRVVVAQKGLVQAAHATVAYGLDNLPSAVDAAQRILF